MQMVRLVRDGEIVKASKRSGKAITLVTLLDEVPGGRRPVPVQSLTRPTPALTLT